MRTLSQTIRSFTFSTKTFPLFLLALCAAAYGPLLTRLGFYWDDFPMSWIATTMGGEGLARYFSTNRPVWGLYYQITTPLLGSTPLHWQIFALLMRWVTGLLLWGLLGQVWRGKQQFAAWAAILFVLYPGFSQQFIAFLYSHFFLVLSVFLLSFYLSVLALRHPRWTWPLTIAALLLAMLNLLSMEYFFLLELLRPLLMWIVLDDGSTNRRQALQRAVVAWLPYLAVFAGAMFWRSVLFGFHTYQPTLMARLREQPLQALQLLIPLIIRDLWLTSFGAIAHAFTLPDLIEIGAGNFQRYWLLVAAGTLFSAVFLLFYKRQELAFRFKTWRANQAWAWQPVALGAVALLIAGGPFWLTDLPISLVFPNDRFILSFMLGACLLIPGLLALAPLPRWIKVVSLSVLLGFTIGLHFQNATRYRNDWSTQRSLFWQMHWRMPDLAPGTVLLANELPFDHYTDNSLSAAINWIYDHDMDPLRMGYILYYPSLRAQTETWLTTQEKDQPIQRDYLATTFYGSTAQVITLYFNPPGCLRVLDPQIDPYNWMVPQDLRNTLPLASTAPILPAQEDGKTAPRPPEVLYGSEPAPNWCYYFQKADLARQVSDWQQVTELAEQAFASGDYPNDPAERLPFIEGYAHQGQWTRALELSRETAAITPVMQPVVCQLWQRINRETPDSAEKQDVLQAIQAENACNP